MNEEEQPQPQPQQEDRVVITPLTEPGSLSAREKELVLRLASHIQGAEKSAADRAKKAAEEKEKFEHSREARRKRIKVRNLAVEVK